MYYLVLLISVLLIGSCACRPADSEYSEYVLDAPNISSLQEEESADWSEPVDDYVITKRELIVSKDNTPVNLTHQQNFLLSDIIARIESSIVHSAFDIVSVFKINKPSDGNNTEFLLEITPSPDEPVTLFSESMSTTIPATHDMPAHVSIDKVTVYELNSGNIPFIPAFQIVSEMQYEKQKNETDDKKIVKRSVSSPTAAPTSSTTVESKVSEVTDAKIEKLVSSTTTASIQKYNSPLAKTSSTPLDLAKTSTTTPSISTSSQVSTHDLQISKSSVSSTTENGKSTTTPKTTTLKSPVKELKEQEQEAKEKVAEIEAEPVILSSRV